MRKRNLAEDFRKVRALISSGRIGELITRVSAIIPGYKNWESKIKVWYLHRKYRKFIAEHTITYNYRLGGIQIESGGCGFKEWTTLQMCAKHV